MNQHRRPGGAKEGAIEGEKKAKKSRIGQIFARIGQLRQATEAAEARTAKAKAEAKPYAEAAKAEAKAHAEAARFAAENERIAMASGLNGKQRRYLKRKLKRQQNKRRGKIVRISIEAVKKELSPNN